MKFKVVVITVRQEELSPQACEMASEVDSSKQDEIIK